MQEKEMMKMIWQLGHHKAKNESVEEWIVAEVPGAVQLDYAKTKDWPSFQFADNYKNYRWMEDEYWTYKTSFEKPELQGNQRCFFVSHGIDYEFEIALNGNVIFHQEGMFKKVELDLTDYLKDNNELKIIVFPAPTIANMPDDRSQAAQSAKPPVSWGWDWHPRLVPMGIWDETGLEIREAVHLKDVFIKYDLTKEFTKAEINIEIEGVDVLDKQYAWELVDPSGKLVKTEKGSVSDLKEKIITVNSPELWWTYDHGIPNLYISIFTLLDGEGKVLDVYQQKIGFRSVQLVMHEGAWDKPDAFPKGRSNPPITMELNGRVIFCKGTNWVNPEIFPGTINKNRYAELLDRAVEANFNILRVWGGGIVNKESFYQLTNEMGILVWTEFPLACLDYKGTPKYLSVLESESEAIIKRIRKHPSLAMWCGGNELFNAWSGMTDQSLALRLLNSQCYKYDPKTPFLPTSPVMGMAHGHYIFRDFDTNEEVYDWMNASENTAYTEYGMPGPASVEILKKVIPENELFPPMPGTSWETHHAFKAWIGDTWLMRDLLKYYFGKPESLEELVAQGQWLQCEGYKAIFEEARRQKPVCSMALNWCYNEPWITAANNSLLSYPNVPKPAFYAVADACRPFMPSARLKKFCWQEGEEFTADIFVLNDTYEDLQAGVITVKLKAGDKEMLLLNWAFDVPQANKNIAGPTVRAILPRFETDKFDVIVSIDNKKELTSTYTLQYKAKEKEQQDNAARGLNQ